RWQGGLRQNVKRLERELNDLKSLLPLIATTSKRESAEQLALEIQQHGFSQHSVEQMRRILHEHSPDPEEKEGEEEEEVNEEMASPSEEYEEAESEELLEEGSLTGFDSLYQEPFQSTYAESSQAALVGFRLVVFNQKENEVD
ncbi:hypothetical protein LTS18_004599, partial [Coniosporium uncinatum]